MRLESTVDDKAPSHAGGNRHEGAARSVIICEYIARFEYPARLEYPAIPVRGASNSSSAACKVGEWLSLVEHLVRDQGVGGSNPLSPTISS